MATTYNSLCNSTFSAANATGIFSFVPGKEDNVPTGPGDTYSNKVSWAYTEYQNATLTQQVLWYNTGGANYSEASALGYNVCVVFLPALTNFANYRAQSDNGDCMTALNEPCVTGINELAKKTTSNIVLNLSPSQKTSAHVPEVCFNIGETVIKNLPSSCHTFFNSTPNTAPNVVANPLTNYGHNESYLYSGSPACVISDDASNIHGLSASSDVFWAVGGVYGRSDNKTYDLNAHLVQTPLTIFLPLLQPTSLGGHSSISHPTSHLSCVHEIQFKEGSRKPPPLPKVSLPGSLSGGDIAGIVVGSVAGAVLIFGLLFWFWRRRKNLRRRKQQQKEQEALEESKSIQELGGVVPTEADSADVNELPDKKDIAVEMSEGVRRNELGGDEGVRHEMVGSSPEVAELSAENEEKEKEK